MLLPFTLKYSLMLPLKALIRPLVAPAALVRCVRRSQGTRQIGNLRVLGKHRFSNVVFHLGANDICFRPSKVSEHNIVELCKLAKVLSDAIICSGPIPVQCGNVAYSRSWSLNCWMSSISSWCFKNNVVFDIFRVIVRVKLAC